MEPGHIRMEGDANSMKTWYEIILKNHRTFIEGTSQVATIARVKSKGLAYIIAKQLRETTYTPENGFEIIIK